MSSGDRPVSSIPDNLISNEEALWTRLVWAREVILERGGESDAHLLMKLIKDTTDKLEGVVAELRQEKRDNRVTYSKYDDLAELYGSLGVDDILLDEPTGSTKVDYLELDALTTDKARRSVRMSTRFTDMDILDNLLGDLGAEAELLDLPTEDVRMSISLFALQSGPLDEHNRSNNGSNGGGMSGRRGGESGNTTPVPSIYHSGAIATPTPSIYDRSTMDSSRFGSMLNDPNFDSLGPNDYCEEDSGSTLAGGGGVGSESTTTDLDTHLDVPPPPPPQEPHSNSGRYSTQSRDSAAPPLPPREQRGPGAFDPSVLMDSDGEHFSDDEGGEFVMDRSASFINTFGQGSGGGSESVGSSGGNGMMGGMGGHSSAGGGGGGGEEYNKSATSSVTSPSVSAPTSTASTDGVGPGYPASTNSVGSQPSWSHGALSQNSASSVAESGGEDRTGTEDDGVDEQPPAMPRRATQVVVNKGGGNARPNTLFEAVGSSDVEPIDYTAFGGGGGGGKSTGKGNLGGALSDFGVSGDGNLGRSGGGGGGSGSEGPPLPPQTEKSERLRREAARISNGPTPPPLSVLNGEESIFGGGGGESGSEQHATNQNTTTESTGEDPSRAYPADSSTSPQGRGGRAVSASDSTTTEPVSATHVSPHSSTSTVPADSNASDRDPNETSEGGVRTGDELPTPPPPAMGGSVNETGTPGGVVGVSAAAGDRGSVGSTGSRKRGSATVDDSNVSGSGPGSKANSRRNANLVSNIFGNIQERPDGTNSPSSSRSKYNSNGESEGAGDAGGGGGDEVSPRGRGGSGSNSASSVSEDHHTGHGGTSSGGIVSGGTDGGSGGSGSSGGGGGASDHRPGSKGQLGGSLAGPPRLSRLPPKPKSGGPNSSSSTGKDTSASASASGLPTPPPKNLNKSNSSNTSTTNDNGGGGGGSGGSGGGGARGNAGSAPNSPQVSAKASPKPLKRVRRHPFHNPPPSNDAGSVGSDAGAVGGGGGGSGSVGGSVGTGPRGSGRRGTSSSSAGMTSRPGSGLAPAQQSNGASGGGGGGSGGSGGGGGNGGASGKPPSVVKPKRTVLPGQKKKAGLASPGSSRTKNDTDGGASVTSPPLPPKNNSSNSSSNNNNNNNATTSRTDASESDANGGGGSDDELSGLPGIKKRSSKKSNRRPTPVVLSSGSIPTRKASPLSVNQPVPQRSRGMSTNAAAPSSRRAAPTDSDRKRSATAGSSDSMRRETHSDTAPAAFNTSSGMSSVDRAAAYASEGPSDSDVDVLPATAAMGSVKKSRPSTVGADSGAGSRGGSGGGGGGGPASASRTGKGPASEANGASSGGDGGGGGGEVVAVKLPSNPLQALLALLLEPKLVIFTVLCESVPVAELDEVAELAVELLSFNGLLDALMHTLLVREVAATLEHATLFRSNSICMRMMSVLARDLGNNFLATALGGVVHCIETFVFAQEAAGLGGDDTSSSRRSMVASRTGSVADKVGRPVSLDSTPLDELESHPEYMFGLPFEAQTIVFATHLVHALVAATELFPHQMRVMCLKMCDIVGLKFPGHRMTPLVGFVLLRFVCPVVVSPDAAGVLDHEPAPPVRRFLVGVARNLQILGNKMTKPGAGKTFSKPIVEFVEKNREAMAVWLEDLINVARVDVCLAPSTQPAEFRVAAVRCIYYYLYKYSSTIEQSLLQETDEEFVWGDLTETLAPSYTRQMNTLLRSVLRNLTPPLADMASKMRRELVITPNESAIRKRRLPSFARRGASDNGPPPMLTTRIVTGADAVAWLQANVALCSTKPDAVAVMKKLLDAEFIHSVTGEANDYNSVPCGVHALSSVIHSQNKRSKGNASRAAGGGLMFANEVSLGKATTKGADTELFVFQSDLPTAVLNNSRVWRERARPALQVVTNLLVAMSALCKGYAGKQGVNVSPQTLGTLRRMEAEELNSISLATCELQTVDLSGMGVRERTVFFLNLHNLLALHLFLSVGYAANERERSITNAVACYNVGGMHFTLEEIQFGILRGGRVNALTQSFRGFDADDPRAALAVAIDGKIDPRLVFGLCNGAVSSPPLIVFQADSLDVQLNEQMMTYLRPRVYVNDKKRQLHYPQMLDWYTQDFAPNREGLIAWLKPILPPDEAVQMDDIIKSGKDVALQYDSYNWDWGSHY